MSTEPIFFNPVFKERIWGGAALRDFHYNIPSERTGECWAFAAHQNGQSTVRNGMYKGCTLGELWEHHRDLFGNLEGDRFPLLTKILDATKTCPFRCIRMMTLPKCMKTGNLEKPNAGISLIVKKMRRSFSATTQQQKKN